MREWEVFEKWAALARMEKAPQPDVAAAVIYRLTVLPEEDAATGIWAFVTVTACAAAVCAFLGYDSWLSLFGNWYGWAQDFASWSLI